MIIQSFSMDGFGLFAGAGAQDLDPGVNLFCGDNETGKSTCLAFFRAMLFGFPYQTESERSFPPLSGGRHGGRLVLEIPGRGRVEMFRYMDAKNKRGPVSLTFGDGTAGGADDLAAILGNVSDRLFKNVFAFSLEELSSFKILSGDEVKSALYGASLGAEILALPKAMEILEKRLGFSYKHRRTQNQLIRSLLTELKETEQVLAQASGQAGRFSDLAMAREGIAGKLKGLDNEVRGIRAEGQRAASDLRLWDDWMGLLDARQRLAAMPRAGKALPEDAGPRLEALLSEARLAAEALDGLEAEQASANARLQDLESDPGILSHGREIEDLAEGRRSRIEGEERLASSRARAASRAREGTEILAELGPGWTREQVLAADVSLAARQKTQDLRDALEATDQARRRSLEVLAERNALQAEAQEKEDRAAQALKDIGEDAVGADDALAREMGDLRGRFQHLASDLPGKTARRRDAAQALLQTARSISPHWDGDRLTAFDLSTAGRARALDLAAGVQRLAGECDRAGRALEEARELAANMEAEARDLEEQEDRTPAGPAGDAQGLDRMGAAVRSLRRLAARHEVLSRESTIVEERIWEKERLAEKIAGRPLPKTGPVLKAVGIALLVLALAGAGLIMWQTFPSLAYTAPGAAGLLAAGLFFLGRALALRAARDRDKEAAWAGEEAETLGRRGEELSGDLARLQDEAGRAWEVLDLEAPVTPDFEIPNLAGCDQDREGLGMESAASPDFDALDRAEVHFEAARRTLAEKDRSRAAAGEAKKRLAREKARVRTLEERLAARRGELDQASENWRTWLSEEGLPEDLPPAGTEALLARVEAAGEPLNRVEELSGELAALEKEMEDLAARARKAPSLEQAAAQPPEAFLKEMDRFLADAERDREKRARRVPARDALDQAARETAEARKRADAARDQAETAAKTLESAQEAWNAWAGDRNFGQVASARAASDFFSRLEKARQIFRDCEKHEKEIASAASSMEEYDRRVKALFAALDREFPGSGTEAAALLAQELHRARSDQAVKKEAMARLEEIREKAFVSAKLKEDAGSRIRELLEAAGAGDQEEFRRLAKREEERKALQKAAADHELAMKKISGESSLSVLEERLSGLTVEDVRSRAGEMAGQLETREAELEELRREDARAAHEMDGLAGSEALFELGERREFLGGQIRDKSREWCVHALARWLLDEAKRRMEVHQQPAVIREASGFFEGISGGRYRQVVAPLGEDALEVVDTGGSRKAADLLSRGTAEQLYLCLRLGYIRHLARAGTRLPVIMDDILVNFDPDRAARTAEAVAELAGENQVLVFTCHPRTVERFRRSVPGAPLFTLQNGAFVRE
ncbi:MAG: AAA family ATPase [Pseudomonadota bacterium]